MAQFQAKRFIRNDVFEILQTIRSHPEHTAGLTDAQLVDAFEVWWPKLESKVVEAEGKLPKRKPARTDTDMISESLELIRALVRETRNPGVPVNPSRVEGLREALSEGRSVSTGLSDKAKALPPAELIDMLTSWDATLPRLLGGAGNVRLVVDALLGGHMGSATTKVMNLTGYDLPKARTFLDSLQLAISRLSEGA